MRFINLRLNSHAIILEMRSRIFFNIPLFKAKQLLNVSKMTQNPNISLTMYQKLSNLLSIAHCLTLNLL